MAHREDQVVAGAGDADVEQAVFLFQCLAAPLGIYRAGQDGLIERGFGVLTAVGIDPIPHFATVQQVFEVYFGAVESDVEAPDIHAEFIVEVATEDDGPFQPFAFVVGEYMYGVLAFAGRL